MLNSKSHRRDETKKEPYSGFKAGIYQANLYPSYTNRLPEIPSDIFKYRAQHRKDRRLRNMSRSGIGLVISLHSIMRRFRQPCVLPRWALSGMAFSLGLSLAAASAGEISPRKANNAWNKTIGPLFDRACVKCHGPLKQKGGLDLSTFQSLVRGGDSGNVVIPGAPDQSRLYVLIQEGSDPHMPPKKQLAPEEINSIETWIAHLGLGQSDNEPRTSHLQEVSPSTEETDIPDAFKNLEIHQAINHYIRAEWRNQGLSSTPRCDDRTFVRRVYLDLVGTGPDAESIRRFLFDGSPDKRRKLAESLLKTEAYAKNMAETFDLLLLGRKGTRAREQRSRHGWISYLESAFAANRPWNEVVREIILARQPDPMSNTGPKNAGALWFVYEHKNDHQSIAESIAPFVFGTQIKCAQCHDHPLAHEIKQFHYWGLVAAFNRSQNVDTSIGIGVSESATGGFINFANLEQESQPAKLAFLNGKLINEKRPKAGEKEIDDLAKYIIGPSKKDQQAERAAIPKFSRRESLATAVTDSNPLLARSLVNHLWALLIGRGLVHPVDEINSKHPPSHPQLLEWLSNYAQSTEFDIKALIKGIIASDAYQLAARSDLDPEQHRDAFISAIEKPLKAETLYRLIIQATGHSESDYRDRFPTKAKTMQASIREQFTDLLPVSYQATLQQAMFLTNSPEIDHLLSPRPGNTSHRLLKISDQTERISETFVSLLGRLPTKTEFEYVQTFLNKRSQDQVAAQKQLMWSLIAGPEFQMNR